MPPDRLHESIHALDPAAGLAPLDADARERMLQRILAAPAPPVAPARRRGRRQTVVLVVAAAAAVPGAAVAWGVLRGTDPPQTVQADWQRVTQLVPLPPGVRWKPLDLDPHASYGKQFALMAALGEAQCRWFAYWQSGHDAGDAGVERAAVRGLRRLRTLMPLHRDGTGEETGGFAAEALAAYDGWVAATAKGDPRPAAQFLRANC